jgi:hypothetical protein
MWVRRYEVSGASAFQTHTCGQKLLNLTTMPIQKCVGI